MIKRKKVRFSRYISFMMAASLCISNGSISAYAANDTVAVDTVVQSEVNGENTESLENTEDYGQEASESSERTEEKKEENSKEQEDSEKEQEDSQEASNEESNASSEEDQNKESPEENQDSASSEENENNSSLEDEGEDELPDNLTLDNTATFSDSMTNESNVTFDKDTGVLRITPNYGVGSFDVSGYITNKSLIKEVIIEEGITNIPEEAFKGCSNLTRISIASTVTSIGNSAFEGCSKMESIALPDGVTSIGSRAFYGCTALKTVNIPSGITVINDYLFEGCSSLEGIELPANLTNIGASAFSHCVGLKKIDLPANLTNIGQYAFLGCNSLTEITIPESVTSIGLFAIKDCSNLKTVNINASSAMTISDCDSLETVNIGDNVTRIPDYFLSNCIKVASLSIPDSVTSIGKKAIYQCNGIKELTIPKGIKTIGDIDSAIVECENLETINYYAENVEVSYGLVSGCNKLTTINFGEKVTEIPAYFMKNCGIESIDIPENITKIGTGAFTSCNSLKKITIPKTVETIGSESYDRFAIYQCSELTELNYNASSVTTGAVVAGCDKLATVNISSDVKSLPEGFIKNCSGLLSLTIPENVTQVGATTIDYDRADRYAVAECNSLRDLYFEPGSCTKAKMIYKCEAFENIHFGKNVKEIPSYFIRNCNNLKEVTIPEGVTTIGSHAFSNCSNLTKVTIPEGVTTIGSFAFDNCASLKTITIPESVTKLGYEAFSSLKSLTDVYYNAIHAEYSGSKVFYYCGGDGTVKIHLGKNVESLPSKLTNGCKIESIDFRNTKISSLKENTFVDSELKEVWIPETLTSIDDKAFDGCSDNLIVHGYDYNGDDASEAKRYANDNEHTFDSLGMHTWEKNVTRDGDLELLHCSVCGKYYFDIIDEDTEASGSSYGSIAYTYRKSSNNFKSKFSGSIGGSNIKVTYGKKKYISLSANDCSIESLASNSSIISVVKYGRYYRLKVNGAGEAKVSFKLKTDNKVESHTVTIKVQKALQEIRLNSSSYTKYVGAKSFDLGARCSTDKLSYKSSNSKNISVSSSGRVTIKCKGTASADIIVTAAGNSNYEKRSRTIKVNVIQNVVLKTRSKSFKVKDLKKTNKTFPLKVTCSSGKYAIAQLTKNKFIKVDKKTGKVTVKKGTRKGKYTIKLRITAKASKKGNATFAARSIENTLTIVVK